MSIERADAQPLHAQIRQILTAEIAAGIWRPGAALPGEPDLAVRFGVSRMTVRQALADLAARGLLVRQRGRATRVAEVPIEQSLGGGHFYAFTSEMARRGLPHRSEVLEVGLARPTREARVTLGLAAGRPAARIVLLRLLGDEPLMLETVSCAPELLPILADPAITEQPLYELLERHAGIVTIRATESIRPVALGRQSARYLAVTYRTPAFAVTRTSFAEREGTPYPVEWRESLVRGDRYRIVADLHREQLTDLTR